MKKIFAMAIAAVFSLPAASFAAPPVDVEIADEEAKDFFSEPEVEEEEEEGVRKNADDAFEELEATEKGAKIKRKKRSRSASDESDDNSNINQNVVNVMVVTGDKDTKAEAKAENKAEVKAEQPPAPVQVLETPVQPPVQKDSKPLAQVDSSRFYGHNTWKSWWEKEPGIGGGDVLFFGTSGGYGGGLYLGLGFEGMFSDWGGIRLTVNGAGFNQHEGRTHRGQDQVFYTNNGDWDFFLGGKTVAPRPANGSVGAAFMHLEDLSLTLHFGGDSGLDLYPSIGVSHFGYHLDTNEQDWTGGSVFLRAGAGLQYIYKRFFIGVDVGWYPVELGRYGVVHNEHGDDEFHERAVDDPFDSRRVTFSGHMGLAL
jgi:hypothetical protein